MLLNDAVFCFFAAAALACSVFAVACRSARQAVVFFVGTLLATAGIFLQLNAGFLFAIQLLVFAGGIGVVFLAAVLATGSVARRANSAPLHRRTRGAPFGIILAALLCFAIWKARAGLPLNYTLGFSRNAEVLSSAFVRRFLLPFEMVSILLAVLLVGAAAIARRRAE